MIKLVKVIAIAGAVMPLSYAIAHDNDYYDRYDSHDARVAERSVDRLQSHLRGERGFEVDNVHVTHGDVACIAYRTDDNRRHDMPELAVVNGSKVYVRNSVENRKFVKAWNKYCD